MIQQGEVNLLLLPNMISSIPRSVFAFLALCLFSPIANSRAADAGSLAALDTVAENDGTLRAALSSYEKSAAQLREKFEKELAALNQDRLKALEQAFSRATSKRDMETVAKLASLINALKDQTSTQSIGGEATKISPLGDWEFVYKGQPRRFHFAKDNSFQGQYAVSGKAFSGTWKHTATKVVLSRQGEQGRFATLSMSDNKEAELRQFNGYEMSGRKVD